MNEPYLTDHADEEYVLQEYVASYMKIDQKAEGGKGFEIFKNLPNFINFLDENEIKRTNDTLNQEKSYNTHLKSNSGYGFRYHEWDNNKTDGKFVKIGTLDYKDLTEKQLM